MSLPSGPSNPVTETAERLAGWRVRIESLLAKLLPSEEASPPRLHRAMRYAALSGGKRVRPLLVYSAGAFLDVESRQLDRTAAAIEIIHAYSLIHDDLPAMDDDDLRRGKPSVHRAFDEATAILAGDALQALAFEILSEDELVPPEPRLAIVTMLAQACGSMGMAGGQVLDLAAVGKTIDLDALETMHRLKTGALIKLCVTAPVVIADGGESRFAALETFGECIGLAFQIRDDILDEIGESDSLGKTAQSDRDRNKPTFPAVIGLEASRRRALELRDAAMDALAGQVGDRAALEKLADYVIGRDR